jgi:hypothetical protein
MTIDEQITGLEAVPTANAEQFRAKNAVLSTLRSLKALRHQFEFERPNTEKVVSLILHIIGENPKPRPSE